MGVCNCSMFWCTSLGLRHEKTCLPGFPNNKGADQPAHPCSLISTFDIRIFESTISKLTTSEISIFQLVSVAEETGLSLALSQTPKDRFSRDEAHSMSILILQNIDGEERAGCFA